MTDPSAHALALHFAQAALDAKAQDVVVLEIGDLTHLAHYFVICHGTSDRQVRAIAERLEEAADQLGEQLHHREGVREARWVLLDYSDVVVHVFDADTRERFRLEDLWADAPRTALAAA